MTRTMAGGIFMGDLLPGLIVLAIGGSVAPPLLLLIILFFGSQRPLPNASSLTLGYFTTCAVIGISGLILFGGAESAVSTVGRVISATVGALLIVLGLRSLLDSPDADAPPPRWIESINAMSPSRAFGFGMALFPLQVKNLAIFVACLNLIIASSLSTRGSIVALMLVLVVFAIPVLVLIGLSAPSLDHARVSADMDGKQQPHDHGRALLRVRSVLPRERSLGSVAAWVIVEALQ